MTPSPMRQLLTHAHYSALINARQPGIWTKLLLVVPVMEVLPLLFLGRSYLDDAAQQPFVMTNMVWAFFTAVVIQCLVSIQGLTAGGRLDTYLHSDGSPLWMLIGFACGVCGLYLLSTLISLTVLSLVVGLPLTVWRMLGYALLSVPISLAGVLLVYGCELRFHRTFHVINLILDAFLIVSCVLWPLSSFSAIVRPLAALSPVTQLNEFIRRSSLTSLGWAFALSFVFVALGVWWVLSSTRNYREHGNLGGA